MAGSVPGDELVRLADLEWLDLSDLIRMDEDWRRTLMCISRLQIAVTAAVGLLVSGFVFLSRGSPAAGELVALGAMWLAVAAMVLLIARARPEENGLLSNLRLVVFLSIIAVTLIMYVLRDLQGDYYLLYLLPLVSAGGYLGFSGGLVAGLTGSVAYAIVFLQSPGALVTESVSVLAMRALVFVLVAALLGLIGERHLSLLGALRASHTQAIQLAVTDNKTGLFNQAFLKARLPSEVSRAERSQTPVSFLLIDVDDMDQINREHGFSMGDTILRTIGQAVRRQLRDTDVPSRWSDDEIGVLLYNSGAQGAEVVARRLAQDLAQYPFADPATKRPFYVTLSQGIAAFPANTRDRTGEELADLACQAMHRAKATHSVVVWPSS